MEQNQILEEVRAFIVSELLDGDGRELDERTPLLELGIVDSLGIVSLLSFVSRRMEIDVPDHEVRAEHFRTLGAIADLVARLRAGSAGGSRDTL
jgi:acyl carrier protein